MLGLVCIGMLAIVVMRQQEADATPKSPGDKAADLAREAVLDFSPDRGYFTAEIAIRARAAEVIDAVPFPPDRNSARQLAWDRQGPLAEGDIQLLVQANAFCDWMEYAADATRTGTSLDEQSRKVIKHLGHWPAVRDRGLDTSPAAAIEAAQRGDLSRLEEILRLCKPPKKR